MFLVFSDHFDTLISKIIFLKKIILMYFREKNTLKNNYNHTLRYLLNFDLNIDAVSSF